MKGSVCEGSAGSAPGSCKMDESVSAITLSSRTVFIGNDDSGRGLGADVRGGGPGGGAPTPGRAVDGAERAGGAG
jgi:hypothetical protein